MVEGAEKRTCHRFVVPDAKAKYKSTGLLVLVKGLSKAYPVVNVSKGGLAFMCDETFPQGQKLVVQLLAPNEIALSFRSSVRWAAQHPESGGSVVGVAFEPFGSRKGWNSLEALDVLRRLDAQYGEGGKADEDEKRRDHA